MDKCKKTDCFYCRVGYGGNSTVCHYMLWTDNKRECPADQCDKYIPRLEARKLGMRCGEE